MEPALQGLNAAIPNNMEYLDTQPEQGDLAREVLTDLRRTQKSINPKWFYDTAGSALFEHITQLPEYYPTRTETGILRENADEIARYCGHDCVLIEPGAGNCEKARLLLDAVKPTAYVPLDISADFLQRAAAGVARDFPWLDVHAVCADFNQSWSFAEALPRGKRVVFYPGSTIGNLEPRDAADFLRRVRKLIGEQGGLVLGVDLHKSSSVLNAAYNDSGGITASFNRNALSHLNAVLNTNFEPECFQHRAYYNEELRRIEMHLISTREQTVVVGDTRIGFTEGESIHTENSYKYTLQALTDLAASAGLEVAHSWFDELRLFSVNYLRAR